MQVRPALGAAAPAFLRFSERVDESVRAAFAFPQALFKQLFSFVNVQLFNQLLLRRECCSFSNGEYVKTGLAQVESWIQAAGAEYVSDSWDELRYIRQVRAPAGDLLEACGLRMEGRGA